MAKKILPKISCAFIVLLLTGCIRDPYTWDVDEMDQLAISYMNEKYNEDFTVKNRTQCEYTFTPEDDPFYKYFYTKVTAENDPDEKTYIVYSGSNRENSTSWVVGDDRMIDLIEPHLDKFIENSLKEYAPLDDTYFHVFDVCSRNIRENTTAISKCLSPKFPIVDSYDDFLAETDKLYICVDVYVPFSMQNEDTAAQDWKEWTDYMHSSFNDDIVIAIILVEDDSFFRTDLSEDERFGSFRYVNRISLG